MEERIKKIMGGILKVDWAIINENFSQESFAAWDSIAQLNLVVEFEREFGIELEPHEIGSMVDFATTVATISQKM